MKHQPMQGQKIKSFTFLKVLGEGAWAVVYEALDQTNNSQVAVKAIPKILMKQTPKLDQLVKTQIRVLRECHNQNVIRFIDTFQNDRTVFIAMQYCNGGDLEKYLEVKKRLTEDEATRFLKQILNGFRGLHQVNAMHRDFKVANVLLHQGICKIADLGFAKQMGKNKVTGTILGTSLTMAPQLLEEKKYGLEADLWSVGVVYYQLMYGKYPFMGISDFDILKKIRTTRPDFNGVNISANSKDFIDKCLTVDPQKRITWREVYDHPLIKSQEKILYGLMSKINLNQNKKFYEGDVRINQDLIYAEKRQFKKMPSISEQNIHNSQRVNIEAMVKQTEQRKKIAKQIETYEKIYLNRRNNIMFIFKFITPYIFNLYKITANHGITLFILSKKAYHDMKTFYQNIKSRINFLKLAFFKEFISNNRYEDMVEMARSDMEIIQAQIFTYQEDIGVCCTEISNELDNIEVIRSKNWPKLVEETITSYQFQLGQNLDRVKGSEKLDLIKVIEALIFYKQNSANADIEKFDRKIQSINYEQAEVSVRSRLESLLKWN